MSDQTQSLFNESTVVTQPNTGGSTPPASPQPDALQDLLLQIKNERGEPKYKTVQDALIGLQHAQTHIQTLLTEKRTVDEELNSLRPVASQVTELQKVVQQLTQAAPAQNATPASQGMSEEAIATLVEQTMTKQQQAQVAKANVATVVESVKKAFGDKAEQTFYDKAKELGMDVASFNALAARTPAAVLKLLGLDRPSTPSQSSTTTSINTTAFNQNTESFIGRNKKSLQVGATHSEIMESAADAKRMVDELAAKGMSIDDLTKPSNYFKHFS